MPGGVPGTRGFPLLCLYHHLASLPVLGIWPQLAVSSWPKASNGHINNLYVIMVHKALFHVQTHLTHIKSLVK